jgi:acyl-CoA thioesterase-1
MITRRNMIGLLLLAGGGSCVASSAKRIVILGDSITAGFGLERSQAYPALLQRKLDAAGLSFEIVNAGVSGDTTSGGLRRVGWTLGPGAAIFVIALGANDGLRGLPVSQTQANLEGMIRAVRSKSPETLIVLAGMQLPENFGQDFREAFAAVFPRVAAQCATLFVPFLLEGVGGIPELNQEDAIHPNVEGQRRVAENVWSVLEGALKQIR